MQRLAEDLQSKDQNRVPASSPLKPLVPSPGRLGFLKDREVAALEGSAGKQSFGE